MVPNVASHIVFSLTLVEKQRTAFSWQKSVPHISCRLLLPYCLMPYARFDRRASRSGMFERRASHSDLSGPRASRSVLCSSHTFKFISYNLILKLKPIL